MLSLIKNELIKLIEKRGNLIGFAIMMVIAGGALLKLGTSSSLENMYSNLQNDYIENILQTQELDESSWLCSDGEFEENLKNKKNNFEKECKNMKIDNTPLDEKDIEGINKKLEYLKVLHKYKVQKGTWQSVAAYGINNANIIEANVDGEQNEEYITNIKNKKAELEKILEKDDYEGFLNYMIKVCENVDTNNGDYSGEFFEKNKPIKNMFSYIKEHNIEYGNWDRVDNIIGMEKVIANKGAGEDQDIENTKELYLIERYKLENNVKAITSQELEEQNAVEVAKKSDNMMLWNIVAKDAPGLLMIVIIFIMVLASGIVATEYSTGTIKFLVLNPKKRRKIITSKYLSLILVSIISVVSFYIIAMVVGIVKGGIGDIGAKYLTVANNQVQCTTAFAYLLKLVGLGSLTMISVMTLAFALSAVTKNSAIGAAVGLVIYLSENLLVENLGLKDIGRYFLMPNIDITDIMKGKAPYYNATLTGAVLTVLIHMILCFMIAYDSFTKKEI